MPEVVDRVFAELSAVDLYDIVRLRNEVFVVELGTCLPELDGRDTELSTHHIWIASDTIGVRPQASRMPVADASQSSVGRAASQDSLASGSRDSGGSHYSDLCTRDAWLARFESGMTAMPVAAYARVLAEPGGRFSHRARGDPPEDAGPWAGHADSRAYPGCHGRAVGASLSGASGRMVRGIRLPGSRRALRPLGVAPCAHAPSTGAEL